MESGQQDIYHVDEPPHLARRRAPEPPAPTGTAIPDASRAYRRAEAGRAPRLHQDHRVRLRRRRGEHNASVVLINKLLWLSLGLVVFVYGVLLVLSTIRARHRAPAADPDALPASAPAPAAPILNGAPVDYADEIRTLREAQSLVESSAADLAAGKSAEAAGKARRAVELAPGLASAHGELARALRAEHDLAGAEAAWRAVLARDPGNNTARIQLAGVFLAAGQFSNALAAARWGLEADTYSEEAHETAAAALTALNMQREALVHLRRLVNMDRENLAAQNNLGIAYLALEDHRNAMETFREVLRLDPGNSAAFYNLAIGHARMGEPAQAVDVLAQASRKLGASFVLSWTQSKDFDPIRGEDAFARFAEHGAQPAPDTNLTAAAAETDPAAP